jgi:CheY-like chemotaxis protein
MTVASGTDRLLSEGNEPPVRVLLVEDSSTVCKMMCMLLESHGHEVRAVGDGASAINAAREFRPDVVVLDLNLPDMSGYDVAARLKEIPELSATMLIALSGRGEAEAKRLSREAGFHHHLVKPAGIDQLESLFPPRGTQRLGES